MDNITIDKYISNKQNNNMADLGIILISKNKALWSLQGLFGNTQEY